MTTFDSTDRESIPLAVFRTFALMALGAVLGTALAGCAKTPRKPPFIHLIGASFDGCWVDEDGSTDVLIDAVKVETTLTPNTGFTEDWCRKQVERVRPAHAEKVKAAGAVAIVKRPEACVSGSPCASCGCRKDSPCGSVAIDPSTVWCREPRDEWSGDTGCYTPSEGTVAIAIDGEKVAELAVPTEGVTSAWCWTEVERFRRARGASRRGEEPAKGLPQKLINSPGGKQVTSPAQDDPVIQQMINSPRGVQVNGTHNVVGGTP